MQKRLFVISWPVFAFFTFLVLGSTVLATGSNLVGLLTKGLGVTEPQAEGGAGAIFKAASQTMSVEDFAKVTDALPEVQSLMTSAPGSEAGSGTISGLASALGSGAGSASSLAGLAGAFSQLGLGTDMIQKFVPIILDYAQSKGGDEVAHLLKMALQ